jgi:prevent-host-death family protein
MTSIAAAFPSWLERHITRGYNSLVKKASITEMKNNLSAYIDSVKNGSPVLIMDRGRPVARLEPVSGLAAGAEGSLARLIRDGVVRQARGAVPARMIASKPPSPKKGASAVRALLDERRDGR